MSVFKKQMLVESFPAYDVFARDQSRNGAIEITVGDTLGLRVDSKRGVFYRRYTPGSSASYALEYNECPAAAYSDALAKGHPTHWINQNSTSLTDYRQPKESLVLVVPGMKVHFEGRYFTLIAQPNDNLGFKPL